MGGEAPPTTEEEAKPDDETKDLRRKPLNSKTVPTRDTAALAGVVPSTGHTATGTRETPTGIHLTTDQGEHGPFDLI